MNADAVELMATVVKRAPSHELRVTLSFNQKITIARKGEGWTGKLRTIFLQQDENGKQLAKVAENKEISISNSGYANFQKLGGKLPVETLQLMPGASRLTIILQDVASGRVGSLTIPIGEVKPVN
jgi:hypothetical protein